MKNINSNSIDFVITWVDGDDLSWKSNLMKYANEFNGDMRGRRYRNWDNLKYIFRGFEKFCPWVNKIHFVTCGHVPSWLDVKHKKLNIVRHSDYIPSEYLPTFNSNVIELNFHLIEGLSSHFVYFNDDMFILKPMSQKDFFRNGKPGDVLCFNNISYSTIANIKLNNLQIIQKYFIKYEVVKKNFFRIFNYKYPLIEMFKTILLLPWPSFTGFYDPHMPISHKKDTFEKLWKLEEEEFKRTSFSKIRSKSDVSHWVFRYYNICSGDFYPIKRKNIHFDWVKNLDQARKMYEHIRLQKSDLLCINDGIDNVDEFPRIKGLVNSAFEYVFPDKSSFEK